MKAPRLVEVESIDCVIEQLQYVRDRYEEENDELRMEASAIKKQRDDLLVALRRLVVLRLTHAGTASQVHQSWEEAVSAIKKAEGPAASWVDRPEYALKNVEGGE